MDSIKKLPTTSRGLHLSHLNLQSICNKFDMVKYHINELQFDIFTFSESWLTEQTTNDMLHIKGYNLLRNDRSWSDNRNRDVKGNIPRISSYTWRFAINTGWFVVLRSNP